MDLRAGLRARSVGAEGGRTIVITAADLYAANLVPGRRPVHYLSAVDGGEQLVRVVERSKIIFGVVRVSETLAGVLPRLVGAGRSAVFGGVGARAFVVPLCITQRTEDPVERFRRNLEHGTEFPILLDIDR